jgi:hypothetical protein
MKNTLIAHEIAQSPNVISQKMGLDPSNFLV